MPVVTIQMAEGRSLDQKRKVAQDITHSIAENFHIDPGMITVMIQELKKENIAKSGVLLSES
ncbi:tautomerase family protein [Methanosphaerula palustris]|uniref:4-oxalocrotonate tautomerase n=1 Tax=Methanosphaerula palustris (strain ATCC BAA-1556 / DSM 19958 / E1-9c) TaxID=521011 RepID=B8GI65_METPE|nr:tautomerase family protein [Methanosphaerula palustris]ACL15416.1 4-oxalocrotonate tautomerase [Methanosphaerula palustris E1-9c]